MDCDYDGIHLGIIIISHISDMFISISAKTEDVCHAIEDILVISKMIERSEKSMG